MALAARTTRPLPSLAAEYRDTPPSGMRLGIALSGGGIRSAAFNLGALQALQERDVLQHADYLAAVSGGNYIASALTISGAYHQPDNDDGRPQWAHGSVEERYLRQHTDYLAPGAKGRVWLGLNIGYGFALNYLPFLLCAIIAGRLTGWLLKVLRLRRVDLRFDGLTLPASSTLTGMLAIAACCVLMAVTLVGVRRFKDGRARPAEYGRSKSEGTAYWLVRLAAALVGVGLVLPLSAELYGAASEFVLSALLREPAGTFDTTRGRAVVAAFWLLASLTLAAVTLGLSRRFRARRLMLVLASAASAGLLLVPLLSSAEYSEEHGVRSAGDLLPVAGALLAVLFMAIRVHNRRYSLHLFYRERLNSAFALVRGRDDAGRVVANPLGYAEPLYFSSIGDRAAKRRLPKLIVCCSVNLTSDEVPVGRFAESFTFEHDESGGRLFGYHDTRRFEAPGRVACTQLTLPSIMAVSGAALSPLMGRFTHRPLRFLMAMTNVRLGVWIRNPRHREWTDGDGGTGDARQVGRLPFGRRTVRWLLHTRVARSVIDGWREPGALYVLREALGGVKSSQRFIYLTDGGHWENLGLVELLRRRCTHVLCFDASSDHNGGGLDIGRAIALARSELGAEVEMDPRATMPAKQFSADVAVRGSIRYPEPEQEARLVYARAVLTEQASWDLLAYKARDGLFPNHSTSQQIFTDEQFESYRALGYDAGCRALELLNIPEILLRDDAPADIGGTATGNGRAAARLA